MAMPKKMTIKRKILLVNVLARLHNFCIGELPDGEEKDIPVELDVDNLNIMNQADGYVELEDVADQSLENHPIGLMHGGEFFDDVTQNECKKHQRNIQMS
jgi:hypothetical protein